MIFPKVRISNLKRESAMRKEMLDRSLQDAEDAFRQKINPINIIREHPKFVASSVLALLPLSKIARKVTMIKSGNGKKGILGSIFQSKLLWKFLKWSAVFLIQKGAPHMKRMGQRWAGSQE